MRSIKILGCGEAHPELCVSSSELDRRFNRPNGWTEKHSGIKTRFYASRDENILSLSLTASQQALEHAGISIRDIGTIINASGVSHPQVPNTAIALAQALKHEKVTTFEVNNSALSFLNAIELASHIIAQKKKNILIVTTEILSNLLNWNQFESSCFYGDGAAAFVVGYERNSTLISSQFGQLDSHTTHSLANYLQVPNHLEFSDIYNQIHPLLDGHTVDWLISQPHERKLPFQVKSLNRFHTHGNQFAASIPCALANGIKNHLINEGEHILMIGTSPSRNYGTLLLRY